ncbi:MAG: SusC/RagA family TonB-linked outer membrane protein [Bacteroidales bacterium]
MKKIKFTLLVLTLLSFGIGAMAQTKTTLKGEVVDKDNIPVIGASIIEKGTTNGTVTNIDGKFSLNVSNAKGTLRITCVGYEKLEIAVPSASQTVKIKLQESSVALNEVVAIGYGVVKKNDATGSVNAIKPDKLNKGLVLNAQDMLIGKVAGVQVTTGGGTPGGSAQIRIRGGSSISASNDPLIVIDGLMLDNSGIKGAPNALSTINPNDIETFTVLKDASATAIYGSRGSNGVIIITTKKGEKGGKVRVAYDGNASLGTIAKTYDVLTGDQFRNFVTNLYATNPDVTALASLGTENTDWQKQIYQDAVSHDHNISVMGSTKTMPYRISAGYTNQNGIIKTSNFERFIASANLNPSFFQDHLKLTLNAKGMYTKNRYADGGVVGGAASFDPTQPIMSTDPKFSKYGGYFQWRGVTGNTLAGGNPVAALYQKNDRATSRDFIGNLESDYKVHFLPDLHLHLTLGMESSYGIQRLNIDTMSIMNDGYGRTGWDEEYKNNTSAAFYAQYSKQIDKHKFDFMVGTEEQHYHRKGSNEYYGKPWDVNKNGTVETGEYYDHIIPSATAWATENFVVSYFGRANYSYANRYLLTATFRNDNSSRFSKENRSAYFPSCAFAWKASEEPMIKEMDIFSELKVRLGYGITGQQDIGVGDYSYMPVYTGNRQGGYYQFGDSLYNTSRPEAYNTKLKWESTTTYNAGIDFGVANSRFTASVDYYFRRTNDLLFVAPIPAGTNLRNKIIQNIGSLENRGIEVTLNGKVISTKDLTWELTYNFTKNINKVTKLDGAAAFVPAGGTFQGYTKVNAVGMPANSFYVYQQLYDANGKMIETGAPTLADPSKKYSDTDAFLDKKDKKIYFTNTAGNKDSTFVGDGVINENDRVFVHSENPDFTMGLSSKLTYKGFDFGVSMRAVVGNYLYNAVESGYSNVSATGIWNSYFVNKTSKAIEDGLTGQPKTYLSDHYVQDASFIRIDNITLGYSFKKLFNAKASGRIYTAVQNPFVYTKYKGLDPEVQGGIDNNIYPRPRTTLIGLSLNF